MTDAEAHQEALKEIRRLRNVVRELQEEFDQYKRESVRWTTADFIGRAEERGTVVPTEEQAQELLERMIQKHDAELGITWVTIDCYLDDFLPELFTEQQKNLYYAKLK